MNQAQKLRKLLDRKEPILTPAVYNTLTDKIIEKAGFELIGISGFGISASFIGKIDVGLVTLTELAEVTGQICGAVKVPVTSVTDSGFGNAINVMRMTEELIRAGVAGIHFEDQLDPKRCGHVAGKQVISMEEAVGKYRAADKIRRELNSDLVLVARTDSRGAPGGTIEEVIRRGIAYADAGAEVVHPEGVLTLDELRQCVADIPAPILYNMAEISLLASFPELKEIGVAIVIDPVGPIRSAIKGVYDYASGLFGRQTEFMIPFNKTLTKHPTADIHDFVGFGEYRQFEETYLPQESVQSRYDQSVGYQP